MIDAPPDTGESPVECLTYRLEREEALTAELRGKMYGATVALGLCVSQLRQWMRYHGNDLATQAAIDAALKVITSDAPMHNAHSAS